MVFFHETPRGSWNGNVRNGDMGGHVLPCQLRFEYENHFSRPHRISISLVNGRECPQAASVDHDDISVGVRSCPRSQV